MRVAVLVAGLTLALTLSLSQQAIAAAAWTPAQVARACAGETVVESLPVPEGAALRALFFAAAPPATARAVLWDHARFPEFMPDVRRIRVLERPAPDRHVVEMIGGKGPIKVRLVSERRLQAAAVTWRSLGGDVARNDGAWRFDAAPGGTLLTYEVHLVPRGPVPGAVVGYLQQQALPAMVAAVKARVTRTERP